MALTIQVPRRLYLLIIGDEWDRIKTPDKLPLQQRESVQKVTIIAIEVKQDRKKSCFGDEGLLTFTGYFGR
ncbi:hypothetical protein L6232_18000 [Shewanella sp. C31]|nr:hypothetical protein [Shewanella electrica]